MNWIAFLWVVGSATAIWLLVKMISYIINDNPKSFMYFVALSLLMAVAAGLSF